MIGTQLPLKSKSHEMKGKIGEQLRKEAIQVLLTDSEINAYRFCSFEVVTFSYSTQGENPRSGSYSPLKSLSTVSQSLPTPVGLVACTCSFCWMQIWKI